MKRLFVFAFCIACVLNAMAWGAKGHDVVAYVAEQHVSKRVMKQVMVALDGKSMVYYANWADNAKHQDEHSYTRTWHYMNINEDEDIENFKRNPKGDAEMAINLLVGQLKSDTLSHDEEKDALRLLIHLVGDIHCPMHLGRGTDRGGNGVRVKFFNSNSNLHKLWDSQLLEAAHKWSYSEWQAQIDRKSKKEIKAIQHSKPIDWAEESRMVAKDVYESIPANSKVAYDEINRYAPVIEELLLKGGLRLAMLLEEIYG